MIFGGSYSSNLVSHIELVKWYSLSTKLMWLGLTSRIIDYSDFKAVNFDRRLQSNLKSNNESESTIAISIWFQYKINLFCK